MQRKHQWPLLLLAGLALLSVATVVSEPLEVMEVSQWVFSGGEAPRQSGPLFVRATIGQPVAARSSEMPLLLSWGYWGLDFSHDYIIRIPFVSFPATSP